MLTTTAKHLLITSLVLSLLSACSQNQPADDVFDTGKKTAIITGEYHAITLKNLEAIGTP